MIATTYPQTGMLNTLAGGHLALSAGRIEQSGNSVAQRLLIRARADHVPAHRWQCEVDGRSQQRRQILDPPALEADPGHQDRAVELLQITTQLVVGAAD